MFIGGGPPEEIHFNDIEESMMDFISPKGCTGLPFEDSEDPPVSK